MRRGISPLLTPDLVHAPASVGHGDSIAIRDAHFLAAATARRLLHLPAVDAPVALAAVRPTGERRLYGNVLLRKGIIPLEANQ